MANPPHAGPLSEAMQPADGGWAATQTGQDTSVYPIGKRDGRMIHASVEGETVIKDTERGASPRVLGSEGFSRGFPVAKDADEWIRCASVLPLDVLVHEPDQRVGLSHGSRLDGRGCGESCEMAHRVG